MSRCCDIAKLRQVGVGVGANCDLGQDTFSLYRTCYHVAGLLDQAREQGGNLGGGAIARKQATHLNLAMCGREDLFYLVEGGCALADGLVLIAEQQEVGMGKVACHHHKLGWRVILDLVDHNKAGVFVRWAHKQQAQIQKLARGETFAAKDAHANTVDAQPLGALDSLVR